MPVELNVLTEPPQLHLADAALRETALRIADQAGDLATGFTFGTDPGTADALHRIASIMRGLAADCASKIGSV